MSLVDAVIEAGPYPAADAKQSEKKRYAEKLSHALAPQIAAALRDRGMKTMKPDAGGKKEKEFQGGLGPKRVDVSYSDDRHGLQFALSIKSIASPSPVRNSKKEIVGETWSKNLKNRFGDLCTEAITLHMRFPYSVVCCLFAMPAAADDDAGGGGKNRTESTFARATKLLATLSGRDDYTGPGEKFENVTMMLFQPATGGRKKPWVRLIDAATEREVTEAAYLETLLALYNVRNPHAMLETELVGKS
jgi:hypothetical protein